MRVPKLSGVPEKAESGAKHTLSGTGTDTLAVANIPPSSKRAFRLLTCSGEPSFSEAMRVMIQMVLGSSYVVNVIDSSDAKEIAELVRQQPFDLLLPLVNNIHVPPHIGKKRVLKAIELLAHFKAQYDACRSESPASANSRRAMSGTRRYATLDFTGGGGPHGNSNGSQPHFCDASRKRNPSLRHACSDVEGRSGKHNSELSKPNTWTAPATRSGWCKAKVRMIATPSSRPGRRRNCAPTIGPFGPGCGCFPPTVTSGRENSLAHL